MFVPDCFWMNRLTAFSPLSRVRLRGSSTESSARPTSRMRIGYPLRFATMRSLNFSAALHPAQRAQDQLARALLDDSAGHLEVLPQNRLPHVFDRQIVRRELIGVDVDIDRPRAAARKKHGSHAGNRLQDFLDAVFGDLGHFPHVATPRDADGNDRAGIEVERVDQRRLHPLRQFVDDCRDFVPDFLRGDVAVFFQNEQHDDRRDPLADDRAQLVDAGDGVDRLFDRPRDRRFQFLGAGARQAGRHRDDGNVDLGKQVDAEEHVRNDSQDDGNRHEHPGEYRPSDANFGDRHLKPAPTCCDPLTDASGPRM